MSFPEEIANLVLDELRIVSPEDLRFLEKIIWARRAQVIYEPLEGSEARLLSVPGKRSIITVSSTESYRPRQRFSIAHELGHLELHRRELNSISCATQSISPFSSDRQNIETEANQFASYFLLPDRFVKPLFETQNPSFELIEEAASLFEVSLTATGSRYMHYVEEPVSFVISRRGRIVRFVPSKLFSDFDFFIRVNDGIERDTMADRLTRGQIIRQQWHSVPANAWLRDDGFMRGAQVKEWSFFSQKYELSMSLIWVDEELYDEW